MLYICLLNTTACESRSIFINEIHFLIIFLIYVSTITACESRNGFLLLVYTGKT